MVGARTNLARRITRLRQDSVGINCYPLYLGCVRELVDTSSGFAPSPAPLAAAVAATRAWMGAAASVSPRLIWSCWRLHGVRDYGEGEVQAGRPSPSRVRSTRLCPRVCASVCVWYMCVRAATEGVCMRAGACVGVCAFENGCTFTNMIRI